MIDSSMLFGFRNGMLWVLFTDSFFCVCYEFLAMDGVGGRWLELLRRCLSSMLFAFR